MKKILFSLLAIAALAACSKSDDDNNSGDGGGSATSTVNNTLPKKITETKTEAGKEYRSVTTYHYDTDGRFISAIYQFYFNGAQTPTSTSIIKDSYENNLLKKTEVETKGDDVDLYTTEHFYNNQKQLIREETDYKNRRNERYVTTSYKYYNNGFLSDEVKVTSSEHPLTGVQTETTYVDKHTTYNGNVVIVIERVYRKDSNNIQHPDTSSTTTVYTFAGENPIKKEVTDSNGYKIVYEYRYDSHKNPLIQPKNNGKITDFTYSLNELISRNNVIAITKTSTPANGRNVTTTHETFEYTYNQSGYPLTIKHYENNQLVGTKEYEY